MNERLQLEAQAVLDVIEKPEVAQSLKQDKNQNLQYLKENYNVRDASDLPSIRTYTHPSLPLTKYQPCTTSETSSSRTATTAVQQITSTISASSPPIPTS